MISLQLLKRINLEHTELWLKHGLLVLVSLIFLPWHAWSQNETVFSNYRLNPISHNPAYAGFGDTLSLVLQNRQQWVNMEGAPKTSYISINSKFRLQSGLAAGYYLDEAGPMRVQLGHVDYAYQIRLNQRWHLDAGVRLSVGAIQLDFSNMSLVHSGDDSFVNNYSTGLKWNTGWGLQLRNDKGLYFSVAQPRVLKYDFGTSSGSMIDASYVIATSGLRVDLNQNLQISPSITTMHVQGAPLNWMLDARLTMQKRLDLGLGYRSTQSFHGMIGIRLAQKYYLAYLFEMPQSAMSAVSGQTNELGLKIRFK